MRKFIRYKIVGLAIIIAIGIVACDTASQETEPIVSPDGYPVATFTPSVTTVIEGDTIIYTINIDKPIDRSITFTLKQTGGTADEEDYTVAPAVLQPYTKSVEMLVITLTDFDTDASETIVGEIGAYSIADRYLLNPSTVNPTPVNLTITNFVSPDLEVAFYWNADVVIAGDTYDAAEYIDFDFLVSPEAEFDIADPWASEIGIYDAATGSHPEEMTLSGLDDGSYLLWCDLYYNDFVGYSDGSVKIPIIATFTRQGTTVIETEVGMDPAEMMADNTPGWDNDPPETYVYNAVIAKVTVAGNKYTITKYDNTTIGPFKSGTPKTPRPLNYKTK
jgi:hypothetical protein